MATPRRDTRGSRSDPALTRNRRPPETRQAGTPGSRSGSISVEVRGAEPGHQVRGRPPMSLQRRRGSFTFWCRCTRRDTVRIEEAPCTAPFAAPVRPLPSPWPWRATLVVPGAAFAGTTEPTRSPTTGTHEHQHAADDGRPSSTTSTTTTADHRHQRRRRTESSTTSTTPPPRHDDDRVDSRRPPRRPRPRPRRRSGCRSAPAPPCGPPSCRVTARTRPRYAAGFIVRTLAARDDHYNYPASTFFDGGNTIDAILALDGGGRRARPGATPPPTTSPRTSTTTSATPTRPAHPPRDLRRPARQAPRRRGRPGRRPHRLRRPGPGRRASRA